MAYIYFQNMDRITQDSTEIRKVGLQMTGLLTTISVGGITQEKLKMLNELNEDITKKTESIVNEASRMDQALKDSREKIKSLRMDLQASSKNYFECQTANKKIRKDLEESQASYSNMQEELNRSQTTLDQMFSEDSFCCSTPVNEEGTGGACDDTCKEGTGGARGDTCKEGTGGARGDTCKEGTGGACGDTCEEGTGGARGDTCKEGTGGARGDTCKEGTGGACGDICEEGTDGAYGDTCTNIKKTD
ncbi:uncharacterized protein LOC128246153 [Mya arenaria]|uniref:uncharacterized protein LOC128246153 n=1 Tax=Mya arenaria TaxID=6604 RepID=UPI0022E3D3F5|nr:uncharacterized protein LOC128246153 [Mya arenaria]